MEVQPLGAEGECSDLVRHTNTIWYMHIRNDMVVHDTRYGCTSYTIWLYISSGDYSAGWKYNHWEQKVGAMIWLYAMLLVQHTKALNDSRARYTAASFRPVRVPLSLVAGVGSNVGVSCWCGLSRRRRLTLVWCGCVQGVPLRLEVGKQDMDKQAVCVFRRDTLAKVRRGASTVQSLILSACCVSSCYRVTVPVSGARHLSGVLAQAERRP
jgi:hypothetical protein